MKGNRAVKDVLYETHGHYCWLCTKKFPAQKLTLHHIKPRAFKGQTTLANGMILCQNCHFNIVNRIKYNTTEYWEVMDEALKNAEILRKNKAQK